MQRDNIVATLNDDSAAIGLIVDNTAALASKLGRDVTLEEATFGHNTGIDALVRNLSIEQGSSKSRRSWAHQDAIAKTVVR